MDKRKKIDFTKMVEDLRTKIITQIHHLCMEVAGDTIIFANTNTTIVYENDDSDHAQEFDLIEVMACEGYKVEFRYDCDGVELIGNTEELSIDILQKLYEDCYDELYFVEA